MNCRATIAVVGAIVPSIVFAADLPSDVFRLGVVEVIGHRIPPADTLAGDRVDAQTLKDLHRDDLSEALQLLPGVTLQNVGQRRERLVSVRGFSSRQVPLSID